MISVISNHIVLCCVTVLCIYKTITLCYIMFIMANEHSLVNSVCHFCMYQYSIATVSHNGLAAFLQVTIKID